MLSLFLASLLFFAIHAAVSGTRLRGVLINWIGQGAYMGLFAGASAGALTWVILAYINAPHVELWADVAALKMLAVPMMAVAVVLAVLAFSTPNPTAAGGENALTKERPARGIIKVTRHPFLVAVTIWAVAHVMANGDLASLVLFGGLLALSLIGPRLIDAKRAANYPKTWPRFQAQTSWIPFAAILQGRAQVIMSEIGWARIGVGVALFMVIVMAGHEWAIGIAVLTGH